jgi:hypothetical protein
MTTETLDYRGYKLKVAPNGTGWRVFVRAPGALFAEAEYASTSDFSDRDGCIAKAKLIVDDLIVRGA